MVPVKRQFIQRPEEKNLDQPTFKKTLDPKDFNSLEEFSQAMRNNRRQQAYLRSRSRTQPTFVDMYGLPYSKDLNFATLFNCIATATDSYNDNTQSANQNKNTLSTNNYYNPIYGGKTSYNTWDNDKFRTNHKQFGFKEIPVDQAKPGDIVQYGWVDKDGTYDMHHAAIYDHLEPETNHIKVNYAAGYYEPVGSEKTGYKKDVYYGNNPDTAYTYVGSPKEQDYWFLQYANAHPVKSIAPETQSIGKKGNVELIPMQLKTK